MELIDIIRASVIIFTIISAVFIASSFAVYKIRVRNKIKPYLKEENIVSPVVLLNGNETAAEHEIIRTKKPESRRISIINENLSGFKIATENKDDLPIHKLRQKPVISYYSFNKNERMHKMNTSRLADEEA